MLKSPYQLTYYASFKRDFLSIEISQISEIPASSANLLLPVLKFSELIHKHINKKMESVPPEGLT